jgi:hypothetical protein
LDGLLHLAALAVAVSAAYVGFDKLARENDEIAAELEEIKTDNRKFLASEFDIQANSNPLIKSSLRIRAVIVLCKVAGCKIKTRWWTKPFHVLHAFYHVPFFSYFLARYDRRFMRVACIISFVSFIYMVGLQVYNLETERYLIFSIPKIPLRINFVVIAFNFFVFVVTLAFASVTAGTHFAPVELRNRCDRLKKVGVTQRDKWSTQQLKEAMRFKGKGPSSILPPPPSAPPPPPPPPP